MPQDQTQQNQGPKDPIQEAIDLRRIGVMRKGTSGCVICDSLGYIFCQCPGNTGSEKDSESNHDEKKSDTNGNKWHELSDKHKELEHSAPYSRIVNPGKIPKLTIGYVDKTKLSEKEKGALLKIFDAMKLVFEEFKKSLKLGDETKDYTVNIADDGKSVTFNIPNVEHHDNFIKLLVSKGFLTKPVPQPQIHAQQEEKTQPSSYKSPTPLKMTPTS